jgi:hypothetical protein
MIADASGAIVYANDAAQSSLRDMAPAIEASVTGFNPATPVGQSLFAVHPEARRWSRSSVLWSWAWPWARWTP